MTRKEMIISLQEKLSFAEAFKIYKNVENTSTIQSCISGQLYYYHHDLIKATDEEIDGLWEVVE